MILKSITLENIRSYKSETINFPKGRVLLSGDIGSGKSTILLAIEFALFGIIKGEMSGAELLRHGAKSGAVELCFEINNKEITVKRILKRSSYGINQESGYLIVDGVKTDLVPKELKARILKIIGYSESLLNKSKSLIYRYTVYTPQEEMKRIIVSNADERINTLRSVFGIDKYKTIKENIAVYTRELKRSISYIEGKTNDIDDIKKQFDEKILQKEKIASDITKQRLVVLSLKELIAKKQLEIDAKEKDNEKIRQIKNQLKILESKIESVKNNIKRYNENISLEKERIVSLEKEIGSEKKVNEEKLREYIVLINKKINEEKIKLNLCIKKIAEEEYKIRESKLRSDKVSLLVKCPTCLQDVTDEHKHFMAHESKRVNEESSDFLLNHKKEKESIELGIQSFEKKLEEYKKIEKTSEIIKLKEKMLLEKIKEKERQEILLQNEHISIEKIISEKNSLEKESLDYLTLEEEFKKIKDEYLIILKKEKDESIISAKLESTNASLDDMILILKKQIESKEELKKKIKELKDIHDCLCGFFEDLVVSMEKNVMAIVYHEFNDLVSTWFTSLVGDDNISLRLNNEFTPSLEQNGYETEVSNLSGGEKTAVALAYRLALNKVINDIVSTVNTKDLIILDEPTTGFSSEQLDRVNDVIKELGLSQVIIVSHESKVESFVDSVIRIVKEEHESRVF